MPRGKTYYSKLLMDLKQLITLKNDDGSVNHRYIPIAQSIVDLAGERVEAQLRKLYAATSDLEKESASAGLQLVIALFSIPMDECFERSKFKKHIREQLQEIGFKPSKVSKLMGAGEFYARHYDRAFSNDPFGQWFSELELIARQNRFLNEYFKNVSKLYELSRMNDAAIYRVRSEFLDDNKVYTQAELEELRRSNPKEECKGKVGKQISYNVANKNSAHQGPAHESLEVMEDADEAPVIRQRESAQSLIGKFFQLIKSGEIEHYLSEYTPTAQAHLIDEIKTGITRLEEFVSKNKTIEVSSAN